MEIVKKGIHYILQGANDYASDIMFCHKDEKGSFINGATNEDFVDVLINRFQYLSEKSNTVENLTCLLKLREVKTLLVNRNKDKLTKRRQYDNTGNGVSVQATGGKSGLEKVA